MKTIKRERQVRLDELLRLVWDGEVVGEKFYDQNNNVLFIGKNDGKIKEADYTCKTDLFTITEEVVITEDTKLNLVYVNGYKKSYSLFNKSIKYLLELWGGNTYTNNRPKYIYLQNEDGSIGELIWKDGGLVD